MSRYHITYKLPGYPSVQVERFADLAAAEARYDELAGNADVADLSQPFDAEVATATASQPAGGGVEISITLTASSPGEEEQ